MPLVYPSIGDEISLYKTSKLSTGVIELGGTTTSSSTTTTTLGVDNLIGHWRFDEASGTNALNDVGTGDANAVGEGSLTWNPTPGDGNFGGYVSLDGFSGFLCDNESGFDVFGKEVTLMLWVRTSNFDNWYTPILTKGDGTSYDMELLVGQVHLQVDGVGSTLHGASPDVRDGLWHHVCAVIGPPTNKTYVDGIVYDTGAHNGDDLDRNDKLVGLGWIDGMLRPINGTNSSLTGDMDDAAIFNRALTQDEILSVITGGVPTTTTTTSTTTFCTTTTTTTTSTTTTSTSTSSTTSTTTSTTTSSTTSTTTTTTTTTTSTTLAPPVIVNIDPDVTLWAIYTPTGMITPVYSTNLKTVPIEWIPITVFSNSLVNGTNAIEFDRPDTNVSLIYFRLLRTIE